MKRLSSDLEFWALSVAAATALVACSSSSMTAPRGSYAETKLVADTAGLGAAAVDTALKNPWGLAFGPTGILWVSNNHSATSTLYDTTGTSRPLVVTIPSDTGARGGAPTGVIFNPTSNFVIPGSTKALFIFAGEDGVISAWNSGTSAHVVANRSANGAVYKGIALAASGGVNFLFATNFRHNAVDVFDTAFAFVKSFTDATVPAGYAPFGIQTVGGQLYVTFAKRLPPDSMDDEAGAGAGYVDIFNADGTLVKRFASGGALNAPWAVALAGPGFGGAAGDLLIGNFGDGHINAYNATSGSFVGALGDGSGAPIVIEGLWGLTFGLAVDSTTLFFAAGPDAEAHGLLGTLKPK